MDLTYEKTTSTTLNKGQSHKPKAAILSRKITPLLEKMFNSEAKERIAQSFDLYPEFVTTADISNGEVDPSQFEILFGTWGFPALDKEQISVFKNLKHVFYGAGSVRYFGRPFLESNIGVSSSKSTNAWVVAEFCLGQILLAAKRYFHNILKYRNYENGKDLKDKIHTFSGYRRTTVGLIGCGKVSRYLIERLRSRNFNILVSDPYLSKADSAFLGVENISIKEVFKRAEIVSNHLPNHHDIEGIIDAKLFSSMQPGSTFLNTGRGTQIHERGMIDVLKKRSDIVALLDVSDPEPPLESSELYSLPNIILSSHIAGCVGQEVFMLIDEAIDSAEKWLRGEPLENSESIEHFDLIA